MSTGEKFYRCGNQPPCSLSALIESSETLYNIENDLRDLEFGRFIDVHEFNVRRGESLRSMRVLCVGTEREMRLLNVLSVNNSLCMDSEDDRLALARSLSVFMEAEPKS